MKRIFDVLIGVLFGLLIAGGVFLTSRAPAGEPVTLLPSPTPEPIMVYVTGAVERPGIYSLPQGSRLRDAVAAAGGFLEGAEIESLNLVLALDDGDQVEIPGTGAIPTPQLMIGGSGLVVVETPAPEALVDLNYATVEELISVPGIGPSTAQKIIEYREEIGGFESVDELLNVPGIGPSTLEQIRPYVFVEEVIQ